MPEEALLALTYAARLVTGHSLIQSVSAAVSVMTLILPLAKLNCATWALNVPRPVATVSTEYLLTKFDSPQIGGCFDNPVTLPAIAISNRKPKFRKQSAEGKG